MPASEKRYALVVRLNQEPWSAKAGRLIGIDQASGGYPYAVDSPFYAHFWPFTDKGKKEALEYRGRDPFDLVEVSLSWIYSKE